jgi:glycosyltransferase involved in cell wall biosynthesis
MAPAPEGSTAEVTVGIPTWNRSESLRRAIASVLRQSYCGFTLVVSDNASDDETADVVASFDDSRIQYRPLDRNIGRSGNTNRIIELAETEFVVLLGDDDELHSDHLTYTVEALKRWPTVGVAHTGCELVDNDGATLDPHVRLSSRNEETTRQSGMDFLERSMRSGWMVCWSSAVFRMEALEAAGGLRPEDGVIDDLPLLMRIATRWDLAYVNRPLAKMTVHGEASSSALGTRTAATFRSSRAQPDLLYECRRNFLGETDLPENVRRRLRRIAERAYRRDLLSHLSSRARGREGMGVTFRALGTEVRHHRRLAADPLTWRFVAGQFGGRRVGDRLRRAARSLRGNR